MTLKLANRSVAYPVGVTEDVFVKVGKFHFRADFVVVDYDVDPRIPLIIGRPFLRTAQALIDVHGEELTLRVNDEAITFNVGHTSRYSYRYDDESVNRIDVIDVTCEEYAQEVLRFSDSSQSGNPTPSLDPIITTSSPSLTPFEGGDFVLEEIEACLISDSILPGIDDAYFDPEGDIRLLEKLSNDDPSSPLPPKELHFEELKMIKSSIDDSSPLDVLGDNSVTFSNPLVDANDDFTSSNDESLPEEDDEPALLVTPLSDDNEDECFDPVSDIDEIDAFLDIDVSTDIEDSYHDSEGDIIYLKSLLFNDTTHNLPLEVFLDHDPRSLKDERDNDDLKSMVKVFDPRIHEKIISPTYVRLPFEDRYYFSLTFVIKIFLPFLTYLVNSLPLLSSGSEDLIFDPGISAYSFYSLEPVAYGSPMKIFPFFCFCPKDKGIRGESS
ncbi:reverse transcriptase domain-containing protein [Tanacetum coccineum]